MPTLSSGWISKPGLVYLRPTMPAAPADPVTRYVKTGDVHIAYQVVGDGPIDVVLVPGFTSNLEVMWEGAAASGWLRRLTSSFRLILLDKRGTGLSDRVPNDALPTLEQRMDDVRVVMDAAGSERAALLGFWEGGPMCILFAATYPERTRALMLYGTPVRFRRADDYPWAPSDRQSLEFQETVHEYWGQGLVYGALAPHQSGEKRVREALGRLERLSASPGAVIALSRMNLDIDVREVLTTVRVPTLVLNRREDPVQPVEAARYLAERIPGARLALLEGNAHLPWIGDSDALVDEIQTFLTGAREDSVDNRILATVLFVDIVGSTERAAEIGDSRWRDLRESFYISAQRSLRRFRGVQVDTAGDGFLARFDGPARGIRCAEEMRRGSRELGLEIRAGLHTGECEIRGEDLAGIAVHIGARVATLADPGAVLVSSTVKDLVAGSGIEFVDLGEQALKGVPSVWRIYEVAGRETIAP